MYTMPWILWAWLGCLRVNDDQFLVQDDRKFDAPETVAPPRDSLNWFGFSMLTCSLAPRISWYSI